MFRQNGRRGSASMLKITATSNAGDAAKRLRAFRSQIPFAKAVAATRTAFDVRTGLQNEIRQVFDRPTPYTVSSLRVVPATKAAPTAEVLFKDYVGHPEFKHYLEPEVYGGERPVKAFERRLQRARVLPQGWLALPGKGAKLDSYGNMSRGQITQILAVLQALPTAGAGQGFQGAQTARSKKRNKTIGDFFSSTPNAPAKAPNGGRLPYGVWQRKGRKGGTIINVLFFVPRARYRRRLKFWETAQEITRKKFPSNYLAAIAQANATAR